MAVLLWMCVYDGGDVLCCMVVSTVEWFWGFGCGGVASVG